MDSLYANKMVIITPKVSSAVSVWLLTFFFYNCSDKKSARTEDITFGLKKKKDINSKKNVRKNNSWKTSDLSGDVVARRQF